MTNGVDEGKWMQRSAAFIPPRLTLLTEWRLQKQQQQ